MNNKMLIYIIPIILGVVIYLDQFRLHGTFF